LRLYVHAAPAKSVVKRSYHQRRHEQFKRWIKTQIVLPSADTAARGIFCVIETTCRPFSGQPVALHIRDLLRGLKTHLLG